MSVVTAVMIGAGQRGAQSYGPYAIAHPDQLKFVAVAEADPERREYFRKEHGIREEMCFTTWEDVLSRPKLADAVLICTQDRMHFEPTLQALRCGYHVLLEKPMSSDPVECLAMGEQAEKSDKVFMICHVLRYTAFFSKLKSLLDEERIGKLVSIQHNENVGFWHQAHSFVRGNWRNAGESSPMILAKCCHDMDILLWLAGSDCISIASHGGLAHFTRENAPENAPQRCLDGCPHESRCPYSAARLYLTENIHWPTSAISNDLSMEGRIKALKEGPYGRCVYYCDNDVVDHQVASMEFANGVTVAFTMCAFTHETSRTLKLMGTKGEIRGIMERNELEVFDFASGSRELITTNSSDHSGGHGGGDGGIMEDFVSLVSGNEKGKGLTSASNSVQSHLMAFAAEKSRVEKRVILMDEYISSLRGTKNQK